LTKIRWAFLRVIWVRVILARMEVRLFSLIRLGLTPYKQAWELQGCLADKIAGGNTHRHCCLRHTHVHLWTRRAG
jgi:hypothetical protein